MELYVYENWTAKNSAKIHHGVCSFCNHGKGFRGTVSNKHGKWHGPFKTYKEAERLALSLGRAEVSNCLICAYEFN